MHITWWGIAGAVILAWQGIRAWHKANQPVYRLLKATHDEH
jgi:hypothetical protein